MYLGFFFIHWSSSETKQVLQSEPIEIDNCPFCNQASSIIYKIYNSKTKHYSAFSIGKGDFNATSLVEIVLAKENYLKMKNIELSKNIMS